LKGAGFAPHPGQPLFFEKETYSSNRFQLEAATRDADRKCAELQQCRDALARLELDLETRSEESANLSREVDALRKCLRETERKLSDAEKDVLVPILMISIPAKFWPLIFM
jgi:chromosome segregation ATPase